MGPVEDNNLPSSTNEKLNRLSGKTEYTRDRTSPRKEDPICRTYSRSQKSSDKKDKLPKQQTTMATENLMAKETDYISEDIINEDETNDEPELTEVELAVIAGVILEKIDIGLANSSVRESYSNGEDFLGFNQKEDTVCLELDKNVLHNFLLGLTLLEKICRSGCVKLNQSESDNEDQNVSVAKAGLNFDEIKTIKNWRKKINFSDFLVKNNAKEKDTKSSLEQSTNLKADSSPEETAAKSLKYRIINPIKPAPNSAESIKPVQSNVNNILVNKVPKRKSNHFKSSEKSKENITLKTKVSRVVKRETKDPILRIDLTRMVLKNNSNITLRKTTEPEPKKHILEETNDDVLEENIKPDTVKMEIMKSNFEKEWAQTIPLVSKKDSKEIKKVKRRRKSVSRNDQKYPNEWEVICSEDGGPPYKCPVCPYQHRVKSYTRRHIVIHMPDELCTWYKCNQCDYKSKRANVLKNHLMVHKTPDEISWYRCTLCEAKFKHKTALVVHSIRHRNKEDCRLYACEMCTYTTPFRYAVTRHMASHKTFADVDQYYKCPICEYKSLNKFYLSRHLKRHEKPAYKCDQCSFEAYWKSNLDSHKLSHSRDDFLIECDFCDFKTLWKDSLKKHKLIKHQLEYTTEVGNKNVLYCANCDYSTTWKRCLVTHMAIHKRTKQQ